MPVLGYIKSMLWSEKTHKSQKMIKDYQGIANLSIIQNGVKKPRAERATIQFTESPDTQWSYGIQIVQEPDTQPFVFPIRPDMNLTQDAQEDQGFITFEIELDQVKKIALDFSHKKNFEDAMHFRGIILRLIYENDNERPFEEADSDEEFLKYLTQKIDKAPKAEAEEFSQNVKKNLAKLEADSRTKFAAYGSMIAYEQFNNQKSEAGHCQSNLIIAIRQNSNFKFNIEVFDENLDPLVKKEITNQLHYMMDNQSKIFSWVDGTTDCNAFQCFDFKFCDDSNTVNLEFVITTSILQNQNQMSYDQVIGQGNNWSQFYDRQEVTEESKMDEEKIYKSYKKSDKMHLEFIPDNYHQKDEEVKPRRQSKISGEDVNLMIQAKLLDRTFVNKKDIIEVYKNESDHFNNLQHIVTLPKLQSSKNGDDINPKKMFLQEQDSMIVISDRYNPKVYNYDLEAAKVVSEIQLNEKVRDICAYEKTSFENPKKEFFGVQQKNILHFDPRKAGGLANIREYKTKDICFNTITGAHDGNVVVGSDTGEIRLIKEVGDRNAKNLLPSMLGDKVRGLDTSKDGNWLLATCKNHLLLFPTRQGSASGFTKTFLKTEKPQPKVLRVNPKAAMKNKIDEMNFISARFDYKKKDLESYIVASSGPFMVIWSMNDILKGDLVSNTIRKMQGDIVCNEFKMDSNDLLAATRTNVFNLKTKK